MKVATKNVALEQCHPPPQKKTDDIGQFFRKMLNIFIQLHFKKNYIKLKKICKTIL